MGPGKVAPAALIDWAAEVAANSPAVRNVVRIALFMRSSLLCSARCLSTSVASAGYNPVNRGSDLPGERGLLPASGGGGERMHSWGVRSHDEDSRAMLLTDEDVVNIRLQ